MTITNGLDILGFTFASVQKNLLLTNFVPTSPTNISGAQTGFGTFNSGFICPCGTTETFTIGTQGQFTSVLQALGGAGTTVDFVLSTRKASNGAPMPLVNRQFLNPRA